MGRTRSLAVLAIVTLIGTTLPGSAATRSHPDVLLPGERPRTVAGHADIVGDAFNLPAPPADLGPAERASWVIDDRPMLGRTPRDWTRWAEGTLTLDRDGGVARGADLAAAVLDVYDALEVTPTSEQIDQVRAAADALDPAVARGFADVVATVAQVAHEQMPVARAVAQRIVDGFDIEEPFLSIAERDAMTLRQERILDAIARFQRDTLPLVTTKGGGGPLFQDPMGLIVLGNTTNDTYNRGSGDFKDPMLVIEPGGRDTYKHSAGGACPVDIDFGGGLWMHCNGLPLAVVADLGVEEAGTDDVYRFEGPPSPVQGAGGPGAIGLLIDAAGDDEYLATLTRTSTGTWGLQYYFDGGAQGFGYAGYGALVDPAGDDFYYFEVRTGRHSIWGLGQGFGGAGGLGVVADASGQDRWYTRAFGANTQGFIGIYTNGTGFYGGVGIQLETGLSDDDYSSYAIGRTTDYYAFGFGAFGGLGVLYDDGGNDVYDSWEQATNTWIDPLLNCAYGTASFGGVGAHIDIAGDDTYLGGIISDKRGMVMNNGGGGPGVAYGVFVDVAGDDHYELWGQGTDLDLGGFGLWEPDGGDGDILGHPLGVNTFGAFADLAGDDTYINAPGENGTVWAFGIDTV